MTSNRGIEERQANPRRGVFRTALFVSLGAAALGVTVFAVMAGPGWTPLSVAVAVSSGLVSVLITVRLAQWLFAMVPVLVGLALTITGSSWPAWLGGAGLIVEGVSCAVAIARRGGAPGRAAFDRLMTMVSAPAGYERKLKISDWLRK